MSYENELDMLERHLDILRQRVLDNPKDIDSLESILFYTKRCITLEALISLPYTP